MKGNGVVVLPKHEKPIRNIIISSRGGASIPVTHLMKYLLPKLADLGFKTHFAHAPSDRLNVTAVIEYFEKRHNDIQEARSLLSHNAAAEVRGSVLLSLEKMVNNYLRLEMYADVDRKVNNIIVRGILDVKIYDEIMKCMDSGDAFLPQEWGKVWPSTEAYYFYDLAPKKCNIERNFIWRKLAPRMQEHIANASKSKQLFSAHVSKAIDGQLVKATGDTQYTLFLREDYRCDSSYLEHRDDNIYYYCVRNESEAEIIADEVFKVVSETRTTKNIIYDVLLDTFEKPFSAFAIGFMSNFSRRLASDICGPAIGNVAGKITTSGLLYYQNYNIAQIAITALTSCALELFDLPQLPVQALLLVIAMSEVIFDSDPIMMLAGMLLLLVSSAGGFILGDKVYDSCSKLSQNIMSFYRPQADDSQHDEIVSEDSKLCLQAKNK